ncbi:hypothetical protein ACU82A_30405 [Bacillus cereus]
MIKQRKAKRSERGIFLQDKELLNTVFQPGTHFKYIIDINQKKVIILPSDKGNTVSKRRYQEKQKPVIDIRKKGSFISFSGM